MFLPDLVDHLRAVPGRMTDVTAARAGVCVLDALACAYGGTDRPWTRQARAVLAPAPQGPEDTAAAGSAVVWADGGRRAGLADAVYANSAAAHSLIHEDMHPASRAHPGSMVVPTALAVGEYTGATMAEVYRAVVVGYEALARAGEALGTAEFVERGFRPSGTFGPFGAAAAAALLLGLDGDEQVSALSLASGTASGVCEWAAAGTADLFFQNAHAARSGLVATLLAGAGARAAGGAVDGQWGLRRALSGSGPAGAVDPAAPLAVDEVYFKAYPSCAFTQETIEASARLAEGGIDPRTIDRIDVEVYSAAAHYPGCDNGTDLHSTLARQMSIQFAVAATVADGGLRPARLAGGLDPAIAGLAARTRVLPNPAVDHLYPGRRIVTVTVTCTDGSSTRADGGGATGLTEEQVADKFREYALDRLGPEGVDGVVTATRNPSTAVRELAASLR